MDRNELLKLLEKIEEKYSKVPEKDRQYGPELSEEESPDYNYETHPGTHREILDILRKIENNSSLRNDLEFGMRAVKLAPNIFTFLGKKVRNNVAIFMEACKGDFNVAFLDAGNNILDNEEYMMMVLKINPNLYYHMREKMQTNPKILTEFVKTVGFLPSEVREDISPELLEKLKPYITHKIEGMREEKYMGTVCEGHNCEFEYIPAELTKTIICCSRGNEKFEIELYESYGECQSGWTTASWGNIDIKKVEEFGKITKIAQGDQTFELALEEYGFVCPAFEVIYDGEDPYYPAGYVAINRELFIDIEQQKDLDTNEEFEHDGIDLETTLHPTKRLDDLQQERDEMDAKVKKAQDLINQTMAQYGKLLSQDEPDIK